MSIATRDNSGLRHWMERVLEEAARAEVDLAPEPVHDLRVALRRCRSIAEGLMGIDPDKTWNAMRREGRRLFHSLGQLRDNQVMQDWLLRLGSPDDPAATTIQAYLAEREQQVRQLAAAALAGFEQKKWRGWIRRLHAHSRLLPQNGMVFKLRALQAWNEAHELHKQALRNRSAASYHQLRIGIKRFRYIVENFLPLQHQEWGRDLKELQDLLGEEHDLAVLWNTAASIGAFPDPESRARWRSLINTERAARIERYRQLMMGESSRWRMWRSGLPPSSRLQAMSLALVQKWTLLHGGTPRRINAVRRLALELYDRLRKGRSGMGGRDRAQRAVLHAAAVLSDLDLPGQKKREKKAAVRQLNKMSPMPGFTAESTHLVEMLVRCQGGKFCSTGDAEFAGLPEEQRHLVMELAGILRLARVLTRKGCQPVGRVEIKKDDAAIVILVEGYSEFGPQAEKAARTRYLLEYAYRRPVLVQNLPAETSEEAAPDSSAEK
jgi:CHAD domain-containing protein